MQAVIQAAVGKAHWHTGKRDFREAIIDPVFKTLQQLARSKQAPAELREMATKLMLQLRPIAGGSIGDTFENDLLKLIFNATAIANIADNAASAPLTDLQYSLHVTSGAGLADSALQNTNETTYGSYVRKNVARSSGGHTVTGNVASPVAAVTFAAGTSGSGACDAFAIGTASSGAGKILFSGTLSPAINVGSGVTPQITAATTITLD